MDVDGEPTVIIKKEVMIKEAEIMADHVKITVGHHDGIGTPSSALTSTHQPVRDEADILHDVEPTVIIKKEVMIKEAEIMADHDMITVGHHDGIGTPSSALTSTHQPVNDEADILHDGEPTVIIKKEVMIKEAEIMADHDMITVDHHDGIGTPSSALTSTHQPVRDEADILHDGEPTVIIKKEVMIKEAEIMADHDMITVDHHDGIGTPSSALTSTHQPVRDEADILHDGEPTVIIKKEVMIKEAEIMADHDMITVDHHDGIGTPSSALTSTHQPVKDEADILHVIIKKEVMIKEAEIMADHDMITVDHHDGIGTPSSALTSTHQPVRDEADILHDIEPTVIIKKEVIIKEEEIMADHDIITVDHQYGVGTPSSFSATSHQPVKDDADILHDLPECRVVLRRCSEEDISKWRSTLTGDKPFTCNSCDYRTGRLNNLKTHLRTHIGEKPFACDSCDFQTGRLSNLKVHVRTHTGEKPFACDNCDYRTSHPTALKRHLITHTGKKPFACDSCNYRAGSLGALKKHMKIHTGDKPFACDRCDYRAGRLCHLQTHMRTHTGEKPFACDRCDYRAGQLSNLKVHERTHTGDKPFACDSCDYRAVRSRSVWRHKKIHSGSIST